jgi:uncharacterized protein
MLIRVSITNFRSFDKETEFNMLVSSDQRTHKDHIYEIGGIELLKTAAIYGANGAGKSNLVKAIAVLQFIVSEGGKTALNSLEAFQLDSDAAQPTTIEIEYITNNVPYLFGISVLDGVILEEWLYQSGLGHKPDALLFHRTQLSDSLELRFADQYVLSEEGKFRLKFYQDELVKNDTLVLKLLAELRDGFLEVKQAFNWFQKELFILLVLGEI